MSVTDVIVLGGGAAGLMCAAVAGARGKSVLVLERAERVGKKILISGGGRCNFTNLGAGPENYLCSQPDFPRSALARYTPDDFIALVERHGIAYHEKKLGQLFCDGSSRQIVQMLVAECTATGLVEIRTGAVPGAAFDRDAQGVFTVPLPGVQSCRGRSVVVATGGLSFPNLGATGFAFDVARHFRLRTVKPRAGLVPLTFAGDALRFCSELSGTAVPGAARASAAGAPSFRENLLFTHRGLSGPAVLQASSYLPAAGGGEVTFDLLPDGDDAEQWLLAEHARGRDAHLANVLAERLPARLAEAFSRPLGASTPLRRLSARKLSTLAQTLRRWTVQPTGTEGYAKAEVTLGGIDTRELNSRTMAARAVPGLHFIGEAVDVTGQLGGYNFQWAWASGFAAGEAVGS